MFGSRVLSLSARAFSLFCFILLSCLSDRLMVLKSGGADLPSKYSDFEDLWWSGSAGGLCSSATEVLAFSAETSAFSAGVSAFSAGACLTGSN